MIVQLLDSLPPTVSGLAHYAQKLQQHWPDSMERWCALAPVVPGGASEAWPTSEVARIGPSGSELIEAIRQRKPRCVILHYVPYGYSATGSPEWLADRLAEWKQGSSCRLVVVFHEMFVTAPPLRRAQLHIPPSRRVFRRLASLADRWVVSNDRYFCDATEAGADYERGIIIPIGSNVEPVSLASSESTSRRLRLTVFGLSASRQRAIRAHGSLVKCLHDRGLVERLTLVGAGAGERDTEMILKVGGHGLGSITDLVPNATEAQVSEVLAASDVGLCAIEAELATKSGVYAACCGHRIVPVVQGGPLESMIPPFVGNDAFDVSPALELLSDRLRLQTLKSLAYQWAIGPGSWPVITRSIFDASHDGNPCGVRT